MGLLGLCVLVETEGMGAKANLLEEGIASGSPISNSNAALRGYEYAINGVYEYNNNRNAGEFISLNVNPWYMVVLPRRVHITTIFFLARRRNSAEKGIGAVFRVGDISDPDRRRENPTCQESVGENSRGHAEAGYYDCDLWGSVLIVDLETAGSEDYLMITELKAYSWKHLNAQIDLDKVVTSSNEPSNNNDFNTCEFTAETLLAKRPIDFDWDGVPALSGYWCTQDRATAKYISWFKVELPQDYNIEAVVLTGFANMHDFDGFRVFASLRHGDTDIDSIPDSDFFSETFDEFSNDSIGYEWTTGSKVARTVCAGLLLNQPA